MESAGSMIARHLSVPYGDGTVTAQDVFEVLTHGSLSGISSPARDVLAGLFTETSPASVLRAVRECGSTLEKAQTLYAQTLELSSSPSLEWERATL